MTAYMMPRATNPARASHFIAGLFAACLPADLPADLAVDRRVLVATLTPH
jgi:hypothetical protein